MTLLEDERDYKDVPGSWSRDLDRILARFPDASGKPMNGHMSVRSKVIPNQNKYIVMGKAKVIQKGPLGNICYRVTFHETWTRTE